MKRAELCQIIQDISGVTVTPLADHSAYVDFCNAWKFHDIQDYLNPDTLEWLLNSLSEDETLCCLDYLRIRFTFLKAEGIPVAFGPYCTEILSESDYFLWAKKAGLPHLPVKDLLVYRDHFPVTTENHILHLSDCLIRHLSGKNNPRQFRQIDAMRIKRADDTYEDAPHKSYEAMVQERYRIELDFMENIRKGQTSAALKNWRRLHNSVIFLKRNIGDTIENARISAAITRTAIRIAGMDAGLPAEINDWITSESARIIRHARTISEIDNEHERFIREYCKLIYECKMNQYSSLVLSAMYQMNYLFQHPVSIADMAANLDVSANHLIRQFRKETGLTPGKYLLRKRLHHAAGLLINSRLPIQEVSAQSGILDSNYFTRLFRKEYGETPGQYRKKYHMQHQSFQFM